MVIPGRFFNAQTAGPWAPQVGAYPNAVFQPGSRLADLGSMPQAPAMPTPTAPPVMAGSVPVQGGGPEGYGGQPDATFGQGTASPNQTVGGVLGALATLGSFGVAPMGAMAGILGGMAFDNERAQQIGTTRGFTDMALQSVGLPTTGQMLGGLFGGAQPVSSDVMIGAPPMNTGLITGRTPGTMEFGGGPGFTDAVVGAPAMNAGLIGGHTPGTMEFDGGGGFGGASAGSPGGGGGGFAGEEGTSSVW